MLNISLPHDLQVILLGYIKGYAILSDFESVFTPLVVAKIILAARLLLYGSVWILFEGKCIKLTYQQIN